MVYEKFENNLHAAPPAVRSSEPVEIELSEEPLLLNQPFFVEELEEELVVKKPETEGSSSLFSATANYVNSIVGAGIIGLPYAFSRSGLWVGIPLLIFLAWLSDHSARLLVKVGVGVNKHTYNDVCEHAFGRFGRAGALFLMFIFSAGCMFAYMLVLGDTLPVVFRAWITDHGLLANREFVLVFGSVVGMLPLCLKKDIHHLAHSSAISFGCAVIIALSVMIRAPAAAHAKGISVQKYPDAFRVIKTPGGAFQAIGIIAYAFVSHHICFIVYGSIKDKSPDKWTKVVHSAILLSLVLFLAFASIGYAFFLDEVRADILLNFPENDQLINVIRLVMAVHMLFVYPVEFFVCRESIASAVWGSKEISKAKHVTLTLVMFSTSLIGACFVQDLAVVFEFIGGLAACAVGYVVPAALDVKLQPGKLLSKERMLSLALVVVGLLGAISSEWSSISARL
mmetsp:Transcript_44765/g.72904  ORF Transcript_44765/g.72904 Transcript_44765/m.72904 type:complete len:453 (+) Transcript_44765:116-1474(+)|eukprot:CAMPEP_0184649930 /NCGR_PEP_ID=MMETSP0308-20130426/7399_1 /TAXON_ID=38269 /ORGANISM="Gloeochaete witrockiana, Strain SAG 46.84" /LENGTH=452 /DNA_ID=CAMNT_0027083073 /DNA_START=84 /DNA_END=1442 /DNA_ORIENTATION=-